MIITKYGKPTAKIVRFDKEPWYMKKMPEQITSVEQLSAAHDSIHKLDGRKLLYFDNTIPKINIESLFRSMSFYLMNRYGKNNYRRKIIEFSKMLK